MVCTERQASSVEEDELKQVIQAMVGCAGMLELTKAVPGDTSYCVVGKCGRGGLLTWGPCRQLGLWPTSSCCADQHGCVHGGGVGQEGSCTFCQCMVGLRASCL